MWAPSVSSLAVRVNGDEHALARGDGGFWRGEADARHGDDYLLVADGVDLPDPASRWQPAGVRGASRVLDTAQFDLEPVGLTLDELVLYEHSYPPAEDPTDGLTRLVPVSEHTFRMPDGEPVVFEIGADGKVQRMRQRFEYLAPVE